MSNKDNDNISLEEKFEKLDLIVGELEAENVSLEKSFELYKQGMDYLKECQDEISAVEKKVLQIKADGEVDEF